MRADVVSPPIGYLLAASASVFAGTLLLPDVALTTLPELRHALGWSLSSILTIMLVVSSRRQMDDLRARSNRILVVPRWRPSASVAVLTLGLLVSFAHSWQLATELAA